MEPAPQSVHGPAPAGGLGDALNLLWTRFLPEIRNRVSLLEAVAASCASNNLSATEQQDAHAAAHKLAGSLGTFNLSRGTDLAREYELLVSREDAPSPAAAERLAAIANELRTIVDNRKV